MLDCLVDCSYDKLSVFLERVKTFRSCTFAVLNIESLDGNLLESLLSFLSNPEIGTLGIRLHLIQREGSMLHTAPWIDGTRWEADDYHSSRDARWKDLIRDKLHIDKVTIVWSPQSGTGKTRYIKEKLNERMIRNTEVESAKVTIHEGSSITALTEALSKKFSKNRGPKAVHLNLAHHFDRSEDKFLSFADCINHFFFSLLVLRVVRDPASAKSFHLSESNWRIYLELPNSECESTSGSVQAWLCRHIPILLLCGRLETPPTSLILDEPTRRVCTYLRAYDNGTIDRKFEPVQHKRILLVLDKSGSMQVDLGTGSALSVATDNALRIFDSHINVGDVS